MPCRCLLALLAHMHGCVVPAAPPGCGGICVMRLRGVWLLRQPGCWPQTGVRVVHADS